MSGATTYYLNLRNFRCLLFSVSVKFELDNEISIHETTRELKFSCSRKSVQFSPLVLKSNFQYKWAFQVSRRWKGQSVPNCNMGLRENFTFQEGNPHILPSSPFDFCNKVVHLCFQIIFIIRALTDKFL